MDTVLSGAAGDGSPEIPMLAEMVKTTIARRGKNDIILRSFA
jgi:hypothetical protein